MFRCESCGTGFNPMIVWVSEICPRCKAGGVESRLSYRLFEPDHQAEPSGSSEETGQADQAPT